MWLIIVTIFTIATYSSLYSVILFVWADSECYVQQHVEVRSLSTVMERSMQFIWWLYPVLWLFWPKEFSCCKRSDSSIQQNDWQRRDRKNSGLRRPNDPVAGGYDGGDSSADDSSCAGRSTASYVNMEMQNTGPAMFGGPSFQANSQSFMLLPNAATIRPQYTGMGFNSTSEVDLTSFKSDNTNN